ncbi:MAG TPA: hypothetical protein VJJ72_02210 [Candidatus Paceibacterota bacterium]
MSETLSPQEQISKLKNEYDQRVAQIEAQMKAESGDQSSEASHDQKKEAVDHVVQEQLGTSPSLQEVPVDADSDPVIVEQLQRLVSVAQEKGPYKAAVEVRNLKNPALTDAFHRAMTSQLFEEFVQKGKLKQVA